VEGTYLAEVSYNATGKVKVLEKGIAQAGRYRQSKADGVRVELLAEISQGFGRATYPAGREFLIKTRNVHRPWTADDDARLEQEAAERARMQEIADRLKALGFDPDMRGLRLGKGSLTMDADHLERLLDLAEQDES
jgi:hypothetical protein